ncbi:diacylglycerol kinase family protein [Vulgatibacter incomptus]|uniref:Diacylglycerol kinase n=1 Tax=Vulgatibacter incomptus TaxID=1391653 RepID=A0A0K1PCJ4_9BACT|nr:diacylglycerol kinase family protein [Vulgatibacter incomptus]AKU91253.1 Diacylglycerol kinase [Vulgatibacter incomptus]
MSFGRQTLGRSFACASRGVVATLATQRNMRIHYAAATLAACLSCVLQLSRVEIAVVLAAIALVWATELVNTAVEAAIDLASPDPHPLARIAKDAAAGAVLVCAAFSIGAGALVFGDKLSPLRLRPGGFGLACAVAAISLAGAGAIALARRRLVQPLPPHAIGPRAVGIAEPPPRRTDEAAEPAPVAVSAGK